MYTAKSWLNLLRRYLDWSSKPDATDIQKVIMYRTRLHTAWPCTPLKDPDSWHGQLQLPGWLQGLSAQLPWQDSRPWRMAPGRAVKHGAAVRADAGWQGERPAGLWYRIMGDTLIAPGPQSAGL